MEGREGRKKYWVGGTNGWEKGRENGRREEIEGRNDRRKEERRK